MLLGVVFAISFDKPQMAALCEVLGTVGGEILAAGLKLVTIAILALLCIGLVVITIESFVRSKEEEEKRDE